MTARFTLIGVLLLLMGLGGGARAQEEAPAPPRQTWSSDGVFGTYDRAALQRISAWQHVEAYVDLIAERAVQLGGTVDATVRSVAARSTLAQYPLNAVTGRQHVDALSSALARFGRVIRAAIADSDRAGDADTNDIFIEISRGVDKWLWMVEAHLAPE